MSQVISPVALTRQLLEQVRQSTENIPHSGAVSDIQKTYKENNKMVDKLQTYLVELQVSAEAIRTKDNSAEIEASVAEYRANLEREYEADKQRRLDKVNSDIDCLQRIIDCEKEKAMAATSDFVIGG